MGRDLRAWLGSYTGQTRTVGVRGDNNGNPVTRPSAIAERPEAPPQLTPRRPLASLTLTVKGHAWGLQSRTGKQLVFTHPDGRRIEMLEDEYKETEAVTDVRGNKQLTIGKVLQTWEVRSVALAGAALCDADRIRAARWCDGQMVR